jgi:hypothetical protein
MRQGLPTNRVAQSAKESKDVNGTLHLARTFAECLPFLAGEAFGELRFAGFQDWCGSAQYPAAGNRGQGAPTRKCLARSLNRGQGVIGCPRRIPATTSRVSAGFVRSKV